MRDRGLLSKPRPCSGWRKIAADDVGELVELDMQVGSNE